MTQRQTRARSGSGFAALVTASLLVTAAANLAPTLVSALAVQIQDDLGIGEAQIGITVSAFFCVGAVSSAASGRMVERVGPNIALRLATIAAGVFMAVTAAMAHTWVALVALVGVAGLANAWAQPAANLYIARGVQAQRQGLAFGIQKSGIPAASLIAGLSVPAIGLTIGWNWAFVLGALLAFAVSLSVPTVQINSATTAATSNTSAARVQASAGTSTKSPGEAATGETVTSSSANTQVSNHQIRKQTSKPRPDVPVRLLILVGTSTCLAAMGSMALSAFFVLYSVETGVGEGTAGLLLMVGSVVGVASRLVMGASADRGRMSPWQMLTTMFVVAAVAFLGMSTGSMTMLFAAMPFAFATSFAWPGLFHLAMVRSNPSAPGAATGITMTGSFVGAVCGPLVFGSLVESLGYGWAWGFATCTSGAAATVMALVSPRIMRRSSLRS